MEKNVSVRIDHGETQFVMSSAKVPVSCFNYLDNWLTMPPDCSIPIPMDDLEFPTRFQGFDHVLNNVIAELVKQQLAQGQECSESDVYSRLKPSLGSYLNAEMSGHVQEMVKREVAFLTPRSVQFKAITTNEYNPEQYPTLFSSDTVFYIVRHPTFDTTHVLSALIALILLREEGHSGLKKIAICYNNMSDYKRLLLDTLGPEFYDMIKAIVLP